MSEYKTSAGKVVHKPFNKMWIVLAVVIVLVIIFWQFLFYDISFIYYVNNLVNLSELPKILVKLFTPKGTSTWGDYFAYMLTLAKPIWQTIQMSFAGALIGSILAIPVAFLASSNIIKTKWIFLPVRYLLNLFRTIPAMVLALIGVFLVGIGVLSGILGLIMFSFGIMAKMLFEAIETVDMSPYEALESTGANKVQAFRFSVVPQIMPTYVSYLIYIFELNIRASAILGFVGIKGIGLIISDNILYHYDRVGAAIIVLLILILTIQLISSYIRGKLQ